MPQTVPFLSIICMFVTLAVCILLPAMLWIIFARRGRRVSSAVLIGTLGFIITQVIIRQPILSLLSVNSAWTSFCKEYPLFMYIIYAFTAGLFETMGRYLVFGGILRKRLDYYTALGAGLGHGGIEAVLLIGIAYGINITLSFMLNNGMQIPFSQSDAIIDTLVNTPSTTFLLAGAERVFTIAFHIMLSVILCYFIIKRKTFAGIVICIAAHTALDFVIPYLAGNGLSIYKVEGLMIIVAIISVIVIRLMKRGYEKALRVETADQSVKEMNEVKDDKSEYDDWGAL